MAKTILVADDTAAVRIFLARALKGEGWEVLAVSQAAEAITALSAGGIDAAVTDYSMPPGPNGLAVVRVANQFGVPVLLHSGQGRIEVPPDLCGQVRAIAKPARIAELIARLRRLLAGEDEPYDM